MQWLNILSLGVQGQGWRDTAHSLDRLPARAENVVTESVWRLSRQSTGMWVDFRSNATALHARTILRVPPHEHQSYIKYLDLYAHDAQGTWRWAGMSKNGFIPSGETPLLEGVSTAWRTYRLYLPLYYVVERIELGVPDEAAVVPMPLPSQKPIVVYGTSIVHGHAASRPGMAWPAIVGRRLHCPVINLGFSGSARMEPELGKLIAELDAALFIIDPLPNMSEELVREHAEPFLRHLQAAQPHTSILMVEDRAHAQEWLFPEMREQRIGKRAAFRGVYERLQETGPFAYIEGDGLLGDDSEATVDGSHPSDLGFVRYADQITACVAQMEVV